MIPLSQLADIVLEGPAQISRENIHRKISIEANVRGRDLGASLLVQQAVGQRVQMPAGYYAEYGGQFRKSSASVPAIDARRAACPVSDFRLSHNLQTPSPAVLIYFNIPIAATGESISRYFCEGCRSAFRRAGFILRSSVSRSSTAWVMISYFRELREQGLSVEDTVRQGAELRLRPVPMTALSPALALFRWRSLRARAPRCSNHWRLLSLRSW